MDYLQAAEAAPPGWRHFAFEDIERLPPAVRAHELARLPESERSLLARRDAEAIERARRAFFWTLVYHLEPDRWDALARAEPIHAAIVEALPDGVPFAVDVGAGSGRLTVQLARRAERVVAIEPSAGLRAILADRAPHVMAIPGWAEALPLREGCAQLTAACGSFGPDPVVLAELRRVTAPGGTLALVSPEYPEWFEANGWRRISAPPIPAPPHERWIDEFFGPPDPPRELVMTTRD